MSTSTSMRLFETEEYAVRLEYNGEHIIVHLLRANVTKDSVVDMRERLESFSHLFATLGHPCLWAAIPLEDTMTQRLASLLGFSVEKTEGEWVVFKYERKA